MTNEIKVGKSTAIIDEQGRLVGGGAGNGRFSTRPDDGVPGILRVSCENGHTGMSIQIPAIFASMIGTAINIENPCPVCGGKLSARGGRYERNKDGVFERVSGMPS